MPTTILAGPGLAGGASAAALRALAATSLERFRADPGLRRPEPEVIRAGLWGGLPQDGLTTDLFNGCLGPARVCYGECFAARAAFERAKVDFGSRVRNTLDAAVLAEDLSHISAAQGFVRNGWNSDPSWGWNDDDALFLLRSIREAGKHPVLLTKAFTKLGAARMRELVGVGVEIRVCVSAFDGDAELGRRVDLCTAFRDRGGLAVPIVMTAAFIDRRIAARQDAIVDHLVALDLPAGENSIRFAPGSPALEAIDPAASRCDREGDLWAGRLYPGKLTVPTLSSVPPGYRGVDPYRHRNAPDWLASLFADPVPTRDEIRSGARIPKPAAAGVAKRWDAPATAATPASRLP